MTAKLKVLICSEHLLTRFGADRIPMLLAEHLKRLGMDVSFACVRCDRAALDRITETVHQIVIPDGLAPVSADQHVSVQMAQIWRDAVPDVVISGGWPFFATAALAKTFGAKGIFIDAGAAPHDGLPDFALPIQQELRRLRERTLPAIGLVLPVSDFVRHSQSEPDRGADQGVHTVLLGADHLTEYRSDVSEASKGERAILRSLKARIADGARIVLALGRHENFGYRNSAAVFPVFEALWKDNPDLHLVVLAGQEAVDPPEALVGSVTVLSSVGDEALQDLLSLSVLGLSLSRWEGFNLPLAEMQWSARPALAFNVGANPEVVAHPWLLAESETEMIGKAKALLRGDDPLCAGWDELIERFRQRFKWRDVFDRWAAFIVNPEPERTLGPPPRTILVDVSSSSRGPTNSGAIRVARRLLSELQQRLELDLVFVYWDGGDRDYRLLGPSDRAFLSSNAGPVDHLGAAVGEASPSVDLLLRGFNPAGSKPALFLPEVILDGDTEARVDWAEARGIPSAAIVYDMSPVFEPRVADTAIAWAFPAYVRALRQVDELWSISKFSQNQFERYTGLENAVKPKREAVGLPGQFSDYSRGEHMPSDHGIEILCVSTIEPRKNHRLLVEAFLQLLRTKPRLDARLVLVGDSYAGVEDLAGWLREIMNQERRIIWREGLSDAELAEQYRRSAFTVYPSFAAGFGRPVLESLWMGAPCLCHEGGVMAELAVNGGCLTVDMSDVRQIVDGLDILVADAELRQALRRQAAGRQIGDWDDYAASIADRLKSVGV